VFSPQSQAHDGQVINEYEGYALSHKGEAVRTAQFNIILSETVGLYREDES
jgi:hypothetical protein